MSILKDVLDGNWNGLKDSIEKQVSEKIWNRIEDKKIDVLATVNGVSREQMQESVLAEKAKKCTAAEKAKAKKAEEAAEEAKEEKIKKAEDKVKKAEMEEEKAEKAEKKAKKD